MGLQPSEFAKAFTALAVAKLLSDRQYNFKLVKNQIKAFIVVFFPAFLISLQPDAGSAVIYLSFFFVLNREGLTLNYIILGSAFIVLFILTIFFGAKLMLIWLFTLISILALYLFIEEENVFYDLIGIKYLEYI